MGKKLNYTKLTLTAPLILALVTPTAALADTGATATATPATFTSAEAPQTAPTGTSSGINDFVDPNNTQVIELTPEQRAELKNVYIDLGDGSSMDVLSIQNMQNESAKKAQARSKAMDKLFSGIIATRDELAAKADAEKKSEEEARAKKVAEEQRQQAEAAAKKADAEKKRLQAETQQTATATPSTNSATVAPQSQSQKKYTPAVAANTATPTYTSNFDVRVDKGSNVDTSVDTSKVDAKRAGIIKTAQTGIGGAYIWGGKTFRAWDCSGFVSWVFAQHGVKLTAYTFSMVGELKPTSNPQPGDIVFQNGYNHVGIYLGNGQMISALNPSEGTIIHSVSVMPVDGYYTAL